jgi:GTP cyclohydrolase II
MVFDAAECECNDQLERALQLIRNEAHGILIFLRQEGRGHGLTHKIRALTNKNRGDDTFTAVERMGDPADIRHYIDAAEVLNLLGPSSINLMTNNPDKIDSLTRHGVHVEEVTPLVMPATAHTRVHLAAKRARGHRIDL